MNKKETALLEYATMLSQLGVEVDKARDYIRWLIRHGIGYNTSMMRQALHDYREVEEMYSQLEARYLKLRDEIKIKSSDSHFLIGNTT